MSLETTIALSRQSQIYQLAREISRQVFAADSIEEALEIIESCDPELILFDHAFTADFDRFIARTRKISDAPVVLVTDKKQENPAACLEDSRVFDWLNGQNDRGRLTKIAERIKQRKESHVCCDTTERFFADDFAAKVSMVGTSEATRHTLRMIKLVANSRCNPILIVGETGTGKELAARAVHLLRHPDEPFVAVNCAALTASLLESELFGHTKGSFTGADREKTGLLELAGAGTLFLDEISEMPIDLQAKLLRVLQEKTFRKVGGTCSIKSNATIIASTNRNLWKETQAHRFRQDLYYRLNVGPINIFPLRSPNRREDIGILADYFLQTSSICPGKSEKINSFTKMALEALQQHNWPGNVRELRNVIERAILYETGDKISLNSIVIDPGELADCPDGSITHRFKNYSLAKAERELIARALQETGWQKTRAAALLGITRATLYAKLKQYNIQKNAAPLQVAHSNPPAVEPAEVLV